MADHGVLAATSIEAGASEWLYAITTSLQRFACSLTFIDHRNLASVAGELLAEIGPAPTYAMNIVLSLLLHDAAAALSKRAHLDASRKRHWQCSGVSARLVVQLRAPNAHCAYEAFRAFLAHFFAHHRQCRPVLDCERAAQLIRERAHETLTTHDIATFIGCNARGLGRNFKTSFGMSLRDYLHCVRLQRALPEIAAGRLKVESIAHTVGFSSKKDLYRALRRWDTTPGDFRLLSPVAQATLLEQVRAVAAEGEANAASV